MKKIFAAMLLCMLLCGCGVYQKEASAGRNAVKSARETVQETVQERVGEAALPVPTQPLLEETKPSESASQGVTAAGVALVEEVTGAGNAAGTGGKILLTGDSRTVCLYCSQVYDEAEYPKHVFYNISESDYTGYTQDGIVVAKGGEGCSWMRAVGMPLVVSHIQEASAIVIWFGINDLLSFADYINYVNGLAQQYEVPVFYATVGPCDGKWASKNNDAAAFNSALTQFLDPSVHLIDACSFIQEGLNNGTFATMDGLHYDYNTSRAVYQYMVEQVNAVLNP